MALQLFLRSHLATFMYFYRKRGVGFVVEYLRERVVKGLGVGVCTGVG